MAYNIIVGRTESDRKKLGERGTIFLGKGYVKMGQTTSLSNNLFIDVARSHVMLVSGKRGTGKSWTLGVIAEELSSLETEVSQNIATVIFDTMGIFWTMVYPNTREEELLRSWKLAPRQFDTVDIYTPKGYFTEQTKRGVPSKFKFSIKPSELDVGDWCNVFGVELTEPIGIMISRIIDGLKEKKNYGLDDIIKDVKKDKRTDRHVQDAVENLFVSVIGWGLFSDTGTKIKDIVKRGRVSVIDISCYTHVAGNWSIKSLVIGLICKKLLNERIFYRKLEEVKAIEAGRSYFGLERGDGGKQEMPIVWILIDEAHEFLPKEGKTAATDILVQLLREGRQPGISMVLATQQPGEIHKDVMTQSDIVISHRITAKKDIDALNNMMQSYLTSDIQRYINDLPRLKGSAIILDDNSERIYPMRVKPRVTWHGGEAPISVPVKRKALLDLGL
ncbi:MAG: ATP-binding protein [Nanoarchaeota archaeon]|nr:ATP-binding protein [Nanoarchaeota archaeon]MBU1445136.1 ATP-binding protein [Nanoarchaeota archaeon]MBU2420078.1 ATP-binding protein [Nanoarchaeota archaeon]MBU2475563.1 ATP-binding protein [Nanoarchaeota archaeon]